MLKRMGVAAALALTLGVVPMTGHADVANKCVATDSTPGQSIVIGSFGALTCTYTAGTADGQITQSTPNTVDVTYEGANGTVSLYHQDALSFPGTAAWVNPGSVGKVITVTVGPDGGYGSIGLVVVGDAS